MRIVLAALALLLLPAPTQAQEDQPWIRYVLKQRCYRHVDMFGAVSYPCFQRRVAVRDYPIRHYRLPENERVERYYTEPPRAHCQYNQQPMSATGDDKLEEERARLSAQERWSINVGNRRGGRFSDIRFADQAAADCIQVVPSSMTERAQATIGLRHWVCTFEAVPCAAPKIPQDEDTRAKRRSEKADDDTGRKLDPRVQYYDAPPPKRHWYQRRRTD